MSLHKIFLLPQLDRQSSDGGWSLSLSIRRPIIQASETGLLFPLSLSLGFFLSFPLPPPSPLSPLQSVWVLLSFSVCRPIALPNLFLSLFHVPSWTTNEGPARNVANHCSGGRRGPEAKPKQKSEEEHHLRTNYQPLLAEPARSGGFSGLWNGTQTTGLRSGAGRRTRRRRKSVQGSQGGHSLWMLGGHWELGESLYVGWRLLKKEIGDHWTGEASSLGWMETGLMSDHGTKSGESYITKSMVWE